jgi:hypothetical protein
VESTRNTWGRVKTSMCEWRMEELRKRPDEQLWLIWACVRQ